MFSKKKEEQPFLGTYTPPPKRAEDSYTVGINEEGYTIIKLTCNGFSSTMAIQPNGVKQLIRLLAATIDEEPKNEIAQ